MTGPTGRQGDQRTVRVRAVCKPCNNGWMNQLESKVRPYLTPMVTGENVTLDQAALATVAQWLTLKVMVVEHDAQNTVLTPQADRSRFRDTLEPPPYYRLYAAHNISADPLFFLRHSVCVAFTLEGPNPPLDDTTKNIQVVTMVAGKVVFQAICTRINDFAIEDRAMALGFHNRCRFWPNPPELMAFPSRPRLDKERILRVATIVERYVAASKVTWLD